MKNSEIYNRNPVEFLDGIPVFSNEDRYTDNYKKIAGDHLVELERSGHNPFMDEAVWVDLEDSTRSLVFKYVEKGSQILDVGVGLGRLLADCTDYDRYGIDISLDYLKQASAKGFDVAYSKIEDMPYKDDVFDCVVACDVLEHVIDLHNCCEQIIRVIRPGGHLIVRVPFLDDLEPYLAEGFPYELAHIRNFDLASLKILFSKVYGLEYLEHHFTKPYLKDSLLKIKIFPLNSRLRELAKSADSPDHPLWLLKGISQYSHEEFRNWIFGLKDSNPKLLEEMLPELVEGLEVSLVFRKGA
jgi:SAM-dependent methyltransferase